MLLYLQEVSVIWSSVSGTTLAVFPPTLISTSPGHPRCPGMATRQSLFKQSGCLAVKLATFWPNKLATIFLLFLVLLQGDCCI